MKPMKVDFLTAIQRGFKGFVDFKGAATRSEFWYWTLFTFLLAVVLSVVESAIWPPSPVGESLEEALTALSQQATPLTSAASIVLFLPNLAITARRFHDAGFSAKWLLLLLLPIAVGLIGAIVIAGMGVGLVTSPAAALPSELLGALLILGGLLLAIIGGLSIFYLVLCLLPSKTASMGNRFVSDAGEMASDDGTTA